MVLRECVEPAIGAASMSATASAPAGARREVRREEAMFVVRDRGAIELQRELGSGSFATVGRGEAESIPEGEEIGPVLTLPPVSAPPRRCSLRRSVGGPPWSTR